VVIVNILSKKSTSVILKDVPKHGTLCWNKCWNDIYLLMQRTKKKSSKVFIYTLRVFTFKQSAQDLKFKCLYTSSVEKAITQDPQNIIRCSFNEQKRQFHTVAYDDVSNSCKIFLNSFEPNTEEWHFKVKRLDFAALNISQTALTSNDYVGLTHESNYLFIIKSTWIFYIDLHSIKVLFRANINNTENLIDLNDLFEFEAIQDSDDIIGLDKKNRKLVYLNLINIKHVSNQMKLKLFTSGRGVEYTHFKLKDNRYLLTFERAMFRFRMFYLKTIKKLGKFSSNSTCKLFENTFFDRNLYFALTSDSNYLILFNRPRTLSVYRMSDYQLIGQVPILSKVKSITSSSRSISILLDTNELITVIIADFQKDDDYMEKINKIEFKHVYFFFYFCNQIVLIKINYVLRAKLETDELGQNGNLQIENELEQIVEQISPMNKVTNFRKSDLQNKMIFNLSSEFDSNLDQS